MIAYYMRLSRAQDREGESQSIENQRRVLMDYQRKQVDLGGSRTIHFDPPHEEYIDDGFTGTNFKRPAWKRLIEDCKKGKVRTILAKDVSRIGRNYIEVEDYLSQIFPMLGVRVICVMESYDSKDAIESEVISLENIMNTYYVKDIRKKQEASNLNRLKHGKVISKITPFGYTCENLDEGWKIEPESAEIVKLIFSEAVAGKGTGEIAKMLNQKGCETLWHWQAKRGHGRMDLDARMMETDAWSADKVGRVLKNEQYTGVRISRKRKIDKEGRDVKRDPEEQFRFENDHEPLVSMEDFQLAQRVFRPWATGGKGQKKEIDFFSGLLRCGKCHRRLYHSGGKSTVYCQRESSLGNPPSKLIYVDDVKNRVWTELKKKAEQAKTRLLQEPAKPDVDGIEQEIEDLKNALMDRYESFADGKISKEEYLRYRDENKEKTSEMEQKLTLARGQEEYLIRRREALTPLAQVADETELTTEILRKTTDAIYWTDGEMELLLKADEFLGDED